MPRLEEEMTPTGISRRTIVAASVLGAVTAAVLLDGPAAVASAPFPLSNPYTGFPLRDDWAAHRARGSAGGLDYGLPLGTPVPAPHAGTMTYSTSGAAGYAATIIHPSGYRSVLMHFSAFVGSARSVAMGEIVGKSGGKPGTPGAGSSTGAHLHWTFETPARANVDPRPYVNTGASAPPPAPPIRKKNMWLFFDTNGSGWLATDWGATTLNMDEYNLMYRVINSNQATSPFAGGTMPEQFNVTQVNMIKAVLARTRV